MQIQYLEPAPGEYRPGVCNIGPREIAKRRVYGVLGVASAIVLWIVLVALDVPQLARAIVVFPLWGGILSLEQARRRFCAGFAFVGIRSVSGSDATESVADAADLAVDRAAARRLVVSCGAIAFAITAVLVVLPV